MNALTSDGYRDRRPLRPVTRSGPWTEFIFRTDDYEIQKWSDGVLLERIHVSRDPKVNYVDRVAAGRMSQANKRRDRGA